MRSKLSPDYHPSEDEAFMNPRQLEYFRQKLLRWRAELLQESTETLNHLQAESLHHKGLQAWTGRVVTPAPSHPKAKTTAGRAGGRRRELP